jgi:hypothetical protein
MGVMGRWLLLGLAACYSPRPDASCELTCDPNAAAACPDGFTCSATGRCLAPGQMTCDPTADADVDIDAPMSGICAGRAGTIISPICFDPTPPPRIIESEMLIDTDGPCDRVITGQTPNVCVIAGGPLVIDARVNVIGSRALVLWSAGLLVIEPAGFIDAASHGDVPPRADTKGPAANTGLDCRSNDTFGFAGANNATGGGGGAGGSFGGPGGRGGAGNGAIGGGPGPNMATLRLTGGCPGGLGGFAGGHSLTRLSGNGGGAVFLLAEREIVVRGTIDASGGGAYFAHVGDGGAGGGSGGLIGFDAAMNVSFDSSARVVALGGGGGSGATMSSSTPGREPTTRPDIVGALVAIGTVPAGDGGGSLTGSGSGGIAASAVGGGGGGGGGGPGVVVVYGSFSTVTGAQIQPPLRENP